MNQKNKQYYRCFSGHLRPKSYYDWSAFDCADINWFWCEERKYKRCYKR